MAVPVEVTEHEESLLDSCPPAPELPDIDAGADAFVSSLDVEQQTSFTATPVTAPPTADVVSLYGRLVLQTAEPLRETGDRVNGRCRFRFKGNRSHSSSRRLPSCMMWTEAHGFGAQTAEHEFRRQRVSLRFLQGGLAVLASGPDVETPVVVDGAAELFGTEFGTGK
ncbi:MAG: hypothetical protein R3C02_03235 [Planctomycetaceae bacterium]